MNLRSLLAMTVSGVLLLGGVGTISTASAVDLNGKRIYACVPKSVGVNKVTISCKLISGPTTPVNGRNMTSLRYNNYYWANGVPNPLNRYGQTIKGCWLVDEMDANSMNCPPV